LFKFHAYLLDNLLTLRHIRLRIVAGQSLTGTTDCETFIVQKTSDLSNDQNVLTLVIASIAPTFNRLQLWELLLPIPEYVRLDRTEIAYLTNREVSLSRNWR
jgi:hypothetical protein